MHLTINGQPAEHPDGLTVAALLASLGLAGSPCAVEVNKDLVPKARHAATVLHHGDAVEVVTLVGGG